MSRSLSRKVAARSGPRRHHGRTPDTPRLLRPLRALWLAGVLLPLLCAPAHLPAQARGDATDLPAPPFVSVRVRAQGIPSLARNISVDLRSASMQEALAQVAAHAGLRLTYSTDLLPADYRISLRKRQISAAEAVVRILRGTTLDLLVAPSGEAVLVRCAPEVCAAGPDALRARTRREHPPRPLALRDCRGDPATHLQPSASVCWGFGDGRGSYGRTSPQSDRARIR